MRVPLHLVALTLAGVLADAAFLRAEQSVFCGNWGLRMPDGQAGWLTISAPDGTPQGELWTVGSPKTLTDVAFDGDLLRFTRRVRLGEPEFPGGPPTGDRIACRHEARVAGDRIRITMTIRRGDGPSREVRFEGKRTPPVPPRPDLDRVRFGEPIVLFNGRDLTGWELTDPRQTNGWKAIDGELVNTSPKLDFAPYSRFGNLRTTRTFTDFNLTLEFKLPPDGNSGVYLRGMYEVQVADRESESMSGIRGVGAVFSRIEPTENAGGMPNTWQSYDITLVDRHATVVLNGKRVIDNQPIAGITNGALQADETLAGPIYLQGDHTAVAYRNIVLRPVLGR